MKIFLIGFMGCGKTYWGQKLSRKLQLPFFDLDAQIEEKEEKSIDAIFNQEGEEYFRLVEKDVLYLLTESHESFVMAAGGGTPCFYNNIAYMQKCCSRLLAVSKVRCACACNTCFRPGTPEAP